MKKIVKFSKPYDNEIFKIKKDFYENNLSNLKSIIKINQIYKSQKLRKYCQNCNYRILKKDFNSFKISYSFCKKCGHLNGIYQITNDFGYKLYKGSKSKLYSLNYIKDYNLRVKKIYIPKVNFLKEVLKEKISILDIGSGAGHFVKACEKKNILATGYESNKHLVDLSKKFLKKNKMNLINMNDLDKIILKNKYDCVSLIGVLEHLQNPNKILNSFVKSQSKYLYFSVPLFSFSTFIEHSNQDIFPRQLGGGHTHLYTKESIYYQARKKNLKIIGEWWFGTDFADLYRTLINKFSINSSKLFKEKFDNFFLKYINEFQKVLDKNKSPSEVHIVLKK